MRQGPHYSQWVDKDADGMPYLRLPLELVEERGEMKSVTWTDNGDGTYTLEPRKEV